jgi:adenylate cyclase class 2
MSVPPEETEVKFHLRSLQRFQKRLLDSGAQPLVSRTYERNLRFDTAQGDLQRAGRLLRLRGDRGNRLTFKQDRRLEGGATTRTEIEVEVSDFGAAQQLLEALDYRVVFVYEKYRSTYRLGAAEVMLDELPFGNFVEIEGALENLRPVSAQLGLDWAAAIPISYHALFEALRRTRGLQFRDLTFENMQAASVPPSDLGVQSADE